MPTPTDAHRKLEALAGDWVGDETLYPSPWAPEQRSAKGTTHNRIAIDGMFLINDYTEERDGEVVFRGHGVYGWDDERKRYTMHWFDSMGMPPSETLGDWVGDTLTFENESHFGKSRYVYVVHGPDRYDFRIERSEDGSSWSKLMEGHFRRVSA